MDDAAFNAALLDRHAPALGGRRYQHRARHGTRLSQQFPTRADRVGATGDFTALDFESVEIVAGRRVFDFDLVKIHTEFFGQQRRLPRIRPLPHLDLRHHEANAAVAADADKGVRRESRVAIGACQGRIPRLRGGFGKGEGLGARDPRKSDDETATGLQKGPSSTVYRCRLGSRDVHIALHTPSPTDCRPSD